MTAAVYFDNKRYDAEVIDESDSGMSLRVPSEATIQAGRRVRVIFKKITFWAVIKWVKANPDSFEFGIRLAK
jgi:hypothetical protein